MKFQNWHVVLLTLFLSTSVLLLHVDLTYTNGWNLRQAQNAMITQNIFEDGFFFLPTRLNFFAPYEGHIILEFPFLHSLTALTYLYWEASEINGRIVNLIFSALNIIIFYGIALQYFNRKISSYLTIIYGFSPIVLYLGHAFLAETSMLTFYLASYYFFKKYSTSGRPIHWVLLCASLAISPLLKPFSGVIYFPILIYLMSERSLSSAIKIRKIVALCLCSVPFIIWFVYGFLINQSASSTGDDWGNWLSILFGRGFIENWYRFDFYKNVILSLTILHLTPILALTSLFGIIKAFQLNRYKFEINWVYLNILILFIFAGPNRGHPYYQIFFLPPLIIFVGVLIENSLYKGKLLFNFLSLGLITHIFFSIMVFVYAANPTKRIFNLMEFKSVVEKYIILEKQPDNFILIHTKNMTSGVFDFYSNKYTSQFNFKTMPDPLAELKLRKSNGAKYLFIINTGYGDSISESKANKKYWKWLSKNSSLIYSSSSIILLEL